MENRYAAQERRKKAVDLIWIHAEPARWDEAVSLLREAIALGDLEAYYYLGRGGKTALARLPGALCRQLQALYGN